MLRRSRSSLCRRALAGATALAITVTTAGGAFAQMSTSPECQKGITLFKARIAWIQKIQALPRKKADPVVACTYFTKLGGANATVLAWAKANKEWCQIEDNQITGLEGEAKQVAAIRGKACTVAAHQVLRVTCCDGPQVADFNAFAQNDPSEYFWSGRTRTLQGSHLHVGDRLWSTEPKMRPMFTFITDTVEKKPQPHNATSHDLIYSRCSERARELQTGKRGQPNCNDNLKQALREIGFADDYVHDAFNIFMTTGCDDQRRLFYVPSEAKKDDFVELYAEIDAIVAISCCPGASSGPASHGLLIEVFEQSRRHDWKVIRQ